MQLEMLLAKVPFARAVSTDRPRDVFEFAYHVADYLTDRHPKGVKAVFVVGRDRFGRRILLPQLVTVASYRSAYTIIERMARVLSPAVMSLDVTPVIVPVTERAIEGMTEDTPFVRRLVRHGVRLTR
jgi:hypothetical protein